MHISPGDILLARFPFTDLSSDKRRPVLVLSDKAHHEDIIVCAITSRPQAGPFDIAVSDVTGSGLKVASWIQIDKIATLSRMVIAGRLGALPDPFIQKHKAILRQLFDI